MTTSSSWWIRSMKNSVRHRLLCMSGPSMCFSMNSHWLFVELSVRALPFLSSSLFCVVLSYRACCVCVSEKEAPVQSSASFSCALITGQQRHSGCARRLTTVGYGFIRHLCTRSFYERPVYCPFFFYYYIGDDVEVSLFPWKLNFHHFSFFEIFI